MGLPEKQSTDTSGLDLIEDGYTPSVVVETLYEWNLNVHAVTPADTDIGSFAQIRQLARLPDITEISADFGRGRARIANYASFAAQQLIPVYGDRIGLFRTLCGTSQIGPCADGAKPDVDPAEVTLYQSADRQGWIASNAATLKNLTPAQRSALAVSLHQHYLLPDYQNFLIGGQQPVYLEKIIALAQAHHAHVVLVWTPLHTLFRQYAFEHPADLQKINQFWQSLANAHGVPYYDLSASPDYTDGDYRDASHMNTSGAEKFSTWLAMKVIGPMVSSDAASRPRGS